MEYTKRHKRTYYRNEFQCGCRVVGDNAGCYTIEYCPKHKAAPELYEALKLLVTMFRSDDYQDWRNSIEIAEKAIAKAEGK